MVVSNEQYLTSSTCISSFLKYIKNSMHIKVLLELLVHEKRHDILTEVIRNSQLFDARNNKYWILHFIISNPVVNRLHMSLYILLIASCHNSSWPCQVKYSSLCWHYLLVFVSYKWFVSVFWILVDERECISIHFQRKPHIQWNTQFTASGNRIIIKNGLLFSPFFFSSFFVSKYSGQFFLCILQGYFHKAWIQPQSKLTLGIKESMLMLCYI